MKRTACSIAILLFISNMLPGQCPGSLVFTARFHTLYDAPTTTNDEKLHGLLALKEEMKICPSGEEAVFALLLQKIGLLYYLKGDFGSAVTATKESTEYARAATPIYDSAIVQNYHNLIYYYASLQDDPSERQAADSCIAIALEKHTNYHDACMALNKKTTYLFNIGDYRLCTISASLGAELVRRYYHDNDSLVYANYFFVLQADVLYFSGKVAAVEGLLLDREASLLRTGHTDYLADVYSMLGRINEERNDSRQALSYFKKAYRANTLSKFNTGISEDLTNMGMIVARGMGIYDEGLSSCLRALGYAVTTADSLVAWRNIANIYALKKQFDKAQYFFRKSFNTLGPGSDESSLTADASGIFSVSPATGFNLYQNILDLLIDKGNALQVQGTLMGDRALLQAAIEVYKKGDLFLTRLKREKGLQFQSNLVWRMDAHSLYEQAIRACYARGDIRNAFYFFERGRAVLLNDQISSQGTLTNAQLSAAATSDRQIDEIETVLLTMDSSSEKRLEVLKRLYLATEHAKILMQGPTLKKPSSPPAPSESVPSLEQVRHWLLQNETRVLMEFFTGDSAVYRLFVSPDSESVVRIDKSHYTTLVGQFLEPIAHPPVYASAVQQWMDRSHQLYRLLIQPGEIPMGRMVVSPDAEFFPLEALVTDTTEGDPHYLLEQHAVSYTYSAGFLLNTTSKVPERNAHVFGFAPVRFPPGLQLPDLPGSDGSLDRIDASFGQVQKITGEHATRSNFLKDFQDYDIVQLYTHASDSSFRNDPVIYFADSPLYLSQLRSPRKMNVRLVVLSACETAKGRLYRGEGVFSFNRSFAALGIPAAISNLWSVDDQSTYRLTELFYTYLADGLPTDLALQKARLEFIRTSPKAKRHPYYWAAAVLTGRSERLAPAPGKTRYYLFSVFLLLLLIGGWWLRKKLIASPPRST